MYSRYAVPAAALTAVLALSLAAAADPVPPSSPLLSAATISVHEEVLMSNRAGKMLPFFHNTVMIARPDEVKVVVGRTDPGKKPHLYVQNGKKEWEYNALTNTYASVAPRTDGGSASQLRDISKINLILAGGQLPAAGKGVQRSVSTTRVDGHAMVVTSDFPLPRVGPDGHSYSYPTRVWISAQTGLLYQWAIFMTEDGKTAPYQQVDFSNWSLNKPIAAARLAWTPPSGSSLYTEPILLAAGTPAPDFAVTTSDGKLVHLSDYKGKTVVLDFWATWCGPCQASMPHLEQVYQQVKDKNVAVLGVCVWDEKPAYDKWVATNIGTRYNFPVAFDPAGRGIKSIAGSLYKVTGIPTQYIIDKNGNVATSSTGYQSGDTILETNLIKQGIDIPVPLKTASAK